MTEESRVTLHAREYSYQLDDDENAALTGHHQPWQDLEKKLTGLGAYDTDCHSNRIIFALTVEHEQLLASITDTIAEELMRLTGRAVARDLEQIEGFGSF